MPYTIFIASISELKLKLNILVVMVSTTYVQQLFLSIAETSNSIYAVIVFFQAILPFIRV